MKLKEKESVREALGRLKRGKQMELLAMKDVMPAMMVKIDYDRDIDENPLSEGEKEYALRELVNGKGGLYEGYYEEVEHLYDCFDFDSVRSFEKEVWGWVDREMEESIAQYTKHRLRMSYNLLDYTLEEYVLDMWRAKIACWSKMRAAVMAMEAILGIYYGKREKEERMEREAEVNLDVFYECLLKVREEEGGMVYSCLYL